MRHQNVSGRYKATRRTQVLGAAGAAATAVALVAAGPAMAAGAAPAGSSAPASPSVTSGASTVIYAPLDRPGPPLDVPAAALAASLTCSANLATAGREPILLVPGTTLTPDVEFTWSYEKAFSEQGLPWCAVTLPESGMADIQVAGEYVVNAIRTLHAETGRKVEIVGHSQGGMVPRWALRFWPDTRAMVDDVIGMAPSNHGTVDANAICLPIVGCAPAIWQQEYQSPFIQALNSRVETFAGISYTDVYTVTDEVVQPNLDSSGSSSLHTGAGKIANISVQSVCPAHVTDHLLVGTADPVAYALVMDALSHPGPADPARVSPAVCGEILAPEVDPVTFPANFAALGAAVADSLATTPHTPTPPPLAPYVTAG